MCVNACRQFLLFFSNRVKRVTTSPTLDLPKVFVVCSLPIFFFFFCLLLPIIILVSLPRLFLLCFRHRYQNSMTGTNNKNLKKTGKQTKAISYLRSVIIEQITHISNPRVPMCVTTIKMSRLLSPGRDHYKINVYTSWESKFFYRSDLCVLKCKNKNCKIARMYAFILDAIENSLVQRIISYKIYKKKYSLEFSTWYYELHKRLCVFFFFFFQFFFFLSFF